MNLIERYKYYTVEEPYCFIKINSNVGQGQYAEKYKNQILIAFRDKNYEDGSIGYWFFTDKFGDEDIKGFVWEKYSLLGGNEGACCLINSRTVTEKPANLDFHNKCIIEGRRFTR